MTRWRLAEWAAAAGYLAFMAALYARCSAAKMLWFDELFTMYLARTPQDLWANLRAGIDLHPPLNYLAAWLSVTLLGESEFALRLPALVGGLAGLAAVYVMVRRRRGPFEAFAALTLAGAVGPVGADFYEARPYGLVFGLVALAALARQERRPLAVAVAVGLGMATHYYFALAVVALGLAEAARLAETRRVDWRMAAALGVSLAVVAGLSPLWTEGPRAYKAGFWGKGPLQQGGVEAAYAKLYDASCVPPLALAFAAAAVSRGRPRPDPTLDVAVSDDVALAALLLAPAMGVVLGSAVGGGDGRYTVFALVGAAPVLARALAATCSGHPPALALAAAGFVAFGAVNLGHRVPAKLAAEADAVRRLADRIDAGTPPGEAVLVGSGFAAARLWHYRLPRARFYFLADPDASLRHGGADTVERAFQALGRVAATPCVDEGEALRLARAGELRYFVGDPTAAADPWLARQPDPARGGDPPWYAVTPPPLPGENAP